MGQERALVGVATQKSPDIIEPTFEDFTALLTEVAGDLVKQLQGDAEGVTPSQL